MKSRRYLADHLSEIIDHPVLLVDFMGRVQEAYGPWDGPMELKLTGEERIFFEGGYHAFELGDPQSHYLVIPTKEPLPEMMAALLNLFLSSTEEQTKEEQLFRELVSGSVPPVTSIKDTLFDLGTEDRLTLVGISGPPAEDIEMIEKLISQLVDVALITRLSPEVLGLVFAKRDDEALAEAYQLRDLITQELYVDPAVYVSHHVARPENLKVAHAHIERLREAFSGEGGGVYFFEDYLFRLFMAGLPEDFITDTYRDLQEKYEPVLSDPELMMTAETFFEEDLNITETSKRLYIHRNTLIYRINKIEDMTSLDIRKYRDALKMHMIFTMKKRVERKV